MAHPSRAPFSYFGGKRLLAPLIVSLLPRHDTYVEAYGGSGAVMFTKSPSRLEVYNDLDGAIVNFFRILRDPQTAARLVAGLQLTPYAREEYEHSRTSWSGLLESDPVEAARAWYTGVAMSFSRHGGEMHGFSYVTTPQAHKAKTFRRNVDALAWFTRRLRDVQVEHLPALELIRRYDRRGTVFYLDPPYVHSTRTKGRVGQRQQDYTHEMSTADHAALLEVITHLRGTAIISGYRSALYDAALVSWQRVDVPTFNWSDNARQGGKRASRTECIWLSPGIAVKQLELLGEATQ